MRHVPARPTGAIAPREIVFRDNLLAVFCAVAVGCGLLFLH
jgi:hypothetical protein